MIESFIIILREGVEAALVIAIVLAYLRKSGRADLGRAVWTGLVLAVLSSVAGAIILRRIELSEEAWEGWTMLLAAVSVTSMVIWMARTSHRLKGAIEGRMGAHLARAGSAAGWGVGLFVFLMVGREGVETVLLFTAVSLTTAGLSSAAGALLGLVAAIALGVAFVKGSVRVDLGRFFRVTSIILGVIALQLFIAGLHELSEGLILPSSRREMEIIGPLVTNDAAFFVLILALTVILLVTGAGAGAKAAPTSTTGAGAGGNAGAKADASAGAGAGGNAGGNAGANQNPAEHRLRRAATQREARWRTSAIVAAGLAAVFIAGGYVYSRAARRLTPALPVTAQGDVVRVPLTEVADGKLHRYSLDVEGTPVRFILVQAAPGNVRTAFDACQICGADGYRQEGPQVICQTCGSAINVPTIGMGGGCNPRHLDAHTDGQSVVVPVAALAAGRPYFVTR